MPTEIEVFSLAFVNNGFIPVKYTGQGENISPPLVIPNIAGNAKSFAIIMDDPDAPMGIFTHWLIWNIPAAFNIIPEGIPKEGVVYFFGNAQQGRNDFGELGYGGPMPPLGQVHTYRIKVYVLDTFLLVSPGSDKLTLESAMNGHIIQFGTLRGKYRQYTTYGLFPNCHGIFVQEENSPGAC
jgi:Raf kinase inhibitor-like YbhB/YbcL family protein